MASHPVVAILASARGCRGVRRARSAYKATLAGEVEHALHTLFALSWDRYANAASVRELQKSQGVCETSGVEG